MKGIIDSQAENSPVRLKAEIEKRSLELLPLQQSIKEGVLRTLSQVMSMQATRDPTAYKRASLVRKCEIFIPTEYATKYSFFLNQKKNRVEATRGGVLEA